MSCSLRCPALGRQASLSYSRRPSSSNQLLLQLARFHPNQLSSYIGTKLLLPAKGRIAMTPQGSAAARKPVQMSFLGVGAPEAILVAVVALVVFGPKGLAEAARSVGSTLRTFQPTIKEVVQVSQELKGTLEKELGIDELRDAARPSPTVRPRTELDNLEGPAGPMSDSLAKVLDPEIEAKRAAAAQMAWGASAAGAAAPTASAAAAEANSAGAAAAAAAPAAAATAAPAAPAPAPKDIGAMSMEELEAELARRRAATAGGSDKRP